MSWKELFPKDNIYFETESGILYNQDALRLLKLLPESIFDAIITDPPYGVTACDWDSIIPVNKMWSVLNKVIKKGSAIVLFGQEPFSSLLRVSNLDGYKFDWYYKKKIASNFASAKYQPMKHIENAMVFTSKGEKLEKYYPIMQPRAESGKNRIKAGYKYNSKKGGDFIGGITRNVTEGDYDPDMKYPENIQEFNNRASGDRGLHPTQKPLALMEYLIKSHTAEGDLVLDFTSGSGSTLVACEKLNRRWVGIEIDESYCESTKERLNKLEVSLFKE